jgi:hypothetical protein
MSRKHFTLLIACIFSIQLAFAQEVHTLDTISVATLRKNPEKYHNKKIAITGYLKLQHEGRTLYETAQEYTDKLYDQSLYVYISSDQNYGELKKKFNQKYVTMIAVFRKDLKGHFSMCYGGLIDIEKIELKS